MAGALFADNGARVELTTEIGRGGEGVLHAIAKQPLACAKIYATPVSPENLRKLRLMIGNSPRDATYETKKHRSIAWPTGVLYADSRRERCVGFQMPRIDTTVFREALHYFDPKSRLEEFGGAFHWKYLFTAGLNLASAVAAIHERGYCVGDLNESNVLIARSALITLVDCDSFQVVDRKSKVVYRCPVGKPEYAAPEALLQLQTKSYRDFDRTPAMDCFALATVLFQLLMLGLHPYSAKGKLVEDAPSSREKIVKGQFPYGEPRDGIAPPDYAPPFEILAPELRSLFVRCFATGHSDPEARPTAREWRDALGALSRKFRHCKANPNHSYLQHLSACPWCGIARTRGQDPFPSPIGEQVALAEPSSATLNVGKRLEYLGSYIDMAVADGGLTDEERTYLLAMAKRLQLPRKKVERLIADELQKARAKPAPRGPGVPRLETTATKFEFLQLRHRKPAKGSFVLSNVGGGVLRGTIASNGKWLRVAQSAIDTTKHRQEIAFVVDSTTLKLGSTHTGTIAIDSNGGNQQVRVLVSMEVTNRVVERFRRTVVIMGVVAADILGTAIDLHPGWTILWALLTGVLLGVGARTLFMVGQKQRLVRGFAYAATVAVLLPLVIALVLLPLISLVAARLPGITLPPLGVLASRLLLT